MSSSKSKIIIDLSALAHNWAHFASKVAPAECASVIKADAYGLGIEAVSKQLYAAGCRTFFVASIQEALCLQAFVGGDARIFILSGVFPGEEAICIEEGFIPVIVSLEMFWRWRNALDEVLGAEKNRKVNAAIKVDTGMSRLGLSELELDEVLSEPDILDSTGVSWVLSHLACADDCSHPLNAHQLAYFQRIKSKLAALKPDLHFSLANSAGCQLGRAYHFDLVRPGVALFGSRNSNAQDCYQDIRAVVSVSLEVIQLRDVPAGASVGYGATNTRDRDRVVAVAAGGYADGIFRSLSNTGAGYVGKRRVPIVGRVSMDSVMFDVTEIADVFRQGKYPMIELLGGAQGVDALAADANTVAYELLTLMGDRFERQYVYASSD